MKKKLDINSILTKPAFPHEKFHGLTKIKKMTRDKNEKYWPAEWKTVFYKGYARLPEIKLPKAEFKDKSLLNILLNRESKRDFSGKKVTLKKISPFLYYSAGIKNSNSVKRFYPSAGGRYPLEIYLISLNTELDRGIYHYYVKNNSLEYLADFKIKQLSGITNISWLKRAGFLVIVTAVFERNTVKYGTRGYRHILEEAGHMSQNFYLIATALGLNACSVGGYVDDYINDLLDIDGVRESVIYFLAVGEKAIDLSQK